MKCSRRLKIWLKRPQDNDNELLRMSRIFSGKQDFESLRSFVSSLIGIRESLVLSERQFQTLEKLLDRLIAETTHLENEKVKKEAEVKTLLIEENVRLRVLLDKKEAQLLAMNEQCKWMLVDSPGI